MLRLHAPCTPSASTPFPTPPALALHIAPELILLLMLLEKHLPCLWWCVVAGQKLLARLKAEITLV